MHVHQRIARYARVSLEDRTQFGNTLTCTVVAAHVLGRRCVMNKQLIEDLRALFAEWRRLGWFDGYEPGEDPGPDADSLTDGGPAADRGPHL
jgi:hypothetical protein